MKITKIIAASALLASVAPAHAGGIMADLNRMFMSNSSQATTLSTRDRVGVFGGSVTMRTPIKPINLVAFDPPRLNAGCGGVDLYGGSFSFINGQELIAVFRSVASNAAGLAFKAAIKVISPSLDSLITEFQSLLQNINNLAKNSCSLAHLIVDPNERAIADAVDGDGSVGSSLKSMFSDATSALKAYNANATDYLTKQGEVNPKAGNQTAKAVLASGSSAILGMAGLPNTDGSLDKADDATNPNSLNNRVLISLLGYDISGTNCSTSNEDGVSDTTASVSANSLGRIKCSGVALLTLDDFVKGGGAGSTEPNNPLKLYTCMNPLGAGVANGGFDPQVCTKMQREDFAYPGIAGWANTMMFGSPTDTTVSATSILGLMNSGASGKFTTAQVQFIKQTGIPLVGLMSKTSNPDFRRTIAIRLLEPVKDCVAASMGLAMYKAALGIQNNNSYVLSDDVKRNIDRLRTDYMTRENACVRDKSKLEITQLLNEAAKLTSGKN